MPCCKLALKGEAGENPALSRNCDPVCCTPGSQVARRYRLSLTSRKGVRALPVKVSRLLLDLVLEGRVFYSVRNRQDTTNRDTWHTLQFSRLWRYLEWLSVAAAHEQASTPVLVEEISMSRKRFQRLWLIPVAILLLGVQVAWARMIAPVAAVSAAPGMHIMEGFLPLGWAVFWWVAAMPFWVVGFIQTRKLLAQRPELRMLLGLAGGFILVLSALKLPSVTGSSSHPTGTGLGTILFGPFVVSILGTIALIFQALLLAHGGISTLGANAMSMAILGPLVGWLVWSLLKGRTPTWLSVFLTAAVADLFTYVVTATQLALAFPDPVGGFLASWLKFAGIFAVTQIPLAVSEGILVVLIYNALQSTAQVELQELGLQEV